MTPSDRERSTRRFLAALALLGALAGTSFRSVSAAEAAAPPETAALPDAPVSESWLISTRCAPLVCPQGVQPERFSYRVSADGCADWNAVDAEAFFARAASGGPIVVFIHGNRTSHGEAIRDGRLVYQRLQCLSEGRAFQFVIWSWPTDQIHGGPRKDALVKAARSDAQSFYLAAWLERLPSGIPVTLIGYSFGARVIGGALHLAEGGTLLGMTRQDTESHSHDHPLRVMLVAAALDSEWLLPGSRNGLAGQHVEQMMATRNCCDRVLRFYPRMRRDDSSSALGFAGPACPERLAASGLRLEVVPVESQVGRDHAWQTYLRSNAVQSRLAWYSFLVDDASPAAETPSELP